MTKDKDKLARRAPVDESSFGYMRTASRASLQALLLARMNKASNARKQIEELLQTAVADLVVAEVARLLIEGAPQVQPRTLQPVAPAPATIVEGEDDPLEPFFRPPSVSMAMLKRLDVEQRKKWRRYHDLYGCLVCGRRDRPHERCGMCHNCSFRTQDRLRRVGAGVKPRPGRQFRPPAKWRGIEEG